MNILQRFFTRRLAGTAGAVVAGALVLAGCSESPTEVVRDLTPPAPPQGVYSVTGDEEVTLFWIRNTEPDFDHYVVWRGPNFQGPYTKLGTTRQTRFVDAGVVNGETYFYAVSAVDRGGNESELSEEEVFDTPRPAGTGLVLVNRATQPDGPSGYDFSTGLLRLADDTRTDVYFEARGGIRLLVARDLDTDVQDAGYRQLDDLDWAPDDGWSPTGEVELIVGHSYYVWTRDNHYAKVRVTSVNDSRVVLDWAYQLDPGNPELKPHPRRVDGPGSSP